MWRVKRINRSFTFKIGATSSIDVVIVKIDCLSPKGESEKFVMSGTINALLIEMKALMMEPEVLISFGDLSQTQMVFRQLVALWKTLMVLWSKAWDYHWCLTRRNILVLA